MEFVRFVQQHLYILDFKVFSPIDFIKIGSLSNNFQPASKQHVYFIEFL